jgi:hypothetical protein
MLYVSTLAILVFDLRRGQIFTTLERQNPIKDRRGSSENGIILRRYVISNDGKEQQ